ncbi:hypothetical protein [Kineosporia sp. NBRC 101731]|uniref:hypothetical protein n=1 Tax=Kineosporia sp. NBRC 101731 TaxID=3032199 RepID=UPI0024A03208|nr:hypothetical protein [Kineosporia sp. NBRC 101731]GLY32509.1 hypothetical protein Kisp02_58740 [Kineosporia sp. NBRC 101731]
MAEPVKVDLDEVADIAAKLKSAAGNLDATGETAPEWLDAGDLTETIVGDFAHLLSNAGNLVVNMQAFGNTVASAGNCYDTTDTASADSYSGGLDVN